MKATESDWKHLEAPAEREDLGFEASFSKAETESILQGLVPEAMEDKWFIYFEDGWLRFHRSWTGAFIYALRLEILPSGSRVAESWVNRNPAQYRRQDAEYDRKLLRFLIDAFLLGKSSVFPLPPGAPASPPGILQHHYAGRGYPEQLSDVTDLRTRLGEMISTAVAGRGSASVSVLVPADADLQTVWVPESTDEPTFLAYSITKTFTAALVLKLCEQGRLSLEDPLARWFPRISQAERISLRRILNHTAGIPDYGGNPSYRESVRSSPSTPWSFDRFGAETFERGLQFEPGRGWGYSNPGYMLLKRIIEDVAGASYRDLVSEYIARPFELGRTFVPESIEDLGSLAPGTSCALASDGAPRDVRQHYHPGWVSHGVVASTSSEIVRFFDLLFRGRFLSPQSLDQMMELVPVPMASGDSSLRWGKPGYGLGLMGDPASPWGLIAGHNGGGPCYSASAFHAFDLGGATVCVMGAIEESFNAEHVAFAILDHLAGS